jgi:predicted NBD/HSP70 family sugar kinase
VLHTVRVARAPISRAQIAEHTGLSQAAVSSLTRRLLDSGALIEAGARPSVGGGRRERELALNPAHAWVIGVKVALHQLSLSLVDFAGEVRSAVVVPLDLPQPHAVLVRLLVERIQACLDDAGGGVRERVAGVGLAVPGFVDSMRGEVHWSAVFDDGPEAMPVALAQALTDALEVPVFIENDANMLALAEQWYGQAAGVANVAVVTLEHGLGLGLVINGELYRGHAGLAAELAHLQVAADGPACNCGKRGCLETFVNHAALVRDAQAVGLLAGLPVPATFVSVFQGFEAMVALARQGDARAREIFQRHGRLIGQWLGNVVNLVAPQLLILDGGAIVAADLFEATLREAMDGAMVRPHRGQVELIVRHRADDDWARGAASLVLQRLDESAAIVESVARHGVEMDGVGRRPDD